MDDGENENQGEQQPDDVRSVVLIHSQQVPLVEHLDLYVFELRGDDFTFEVFPEAPKVPFRPVLIVSAHALPVQRTINVKVIVCIAILPVLDDGVPSREAREVAIEVVEHTRTAFAGERRPLSSHRCRWLHVNVERRYSSLTLT